MRLDIPNVSFKLLALEYVPAHLDKCMGCWRAGWVDAWMHGCMDGMGVRCLPRVLTSHTLTDSRVADGCKDELPPCALNDMPRLDRSLLLALLRTQCGKEGRGLGLRTGVRSGGVCVGGGRWQDQGSNKGAAGQERVFSDIGDGHDVLWR
eukprot:349823-Chlamydomonas_euryale.AAC.4